ncbi:hypothetical protein F4819DRAFT_448227 [Hypoxylon fuscum]|nr:hypothetical protein F4819DRAFT_448227 [Hypoxylon fuscum]
MMLMETQGPGAMYGVTITLTVLNCMAVPMRLYRRKKQKQGFMLDDWLVVPALALNIGMAVAIWIGVSKHAVGYPTPPITQARNITARTPLDQVGEVISMNEKIFFIVYTMFAASLSLSKASILCFYQRIFCPQSPWRDITVLSIAFMLTVVVMFGIGITFATVFACGTHFSYWWSSAGADLKAHCVNTQMLTYAQSVSDFIIDVIIIVMPVPLVWKLHMSPQRKLGVIAVFLTAAVAVAASLVKMIWFLWENQTPWDPSFDQDLLSSTFLFWTIMETHIALIAACLPTLRQYFSGYHSIDSVLRSLRTTISLSSLKTTKSRESEKDKETQHGFLPEETL